MYAVEVQNQPDAEFPRRMFVYHYRLLDRYNRSVVSLAVLGDPRIDWRPGRFEHELWGCRLEFAFPTVKLLDLSKQVSIMEDENENAAALRMVRWNPFQIIIAAHLAAMQTQRDVTARFQSKWKLVRTLYDQGMRPDDVRQLFRLIDWLIDLPRELTERFSDALHDLEKEKQMPYVTSVERLAEQKGYEQGIEAVLRLRFGEGGLALMPEIRALSDVGLLQTILADAERVDNPSELRQLWLRAQGGNPEHVGLASALPVKNLRHVQLTTSANL